MEGFFFFFGQLWHEWQVCGGCGIGGGFLVSGWVVAFVVIVGIVVASGAENSWVEEKERDRERENKK